MQVDVANPAFVLRQGDLPPAGLARIHDAVAQRLLAQLSPEGEQIVAGESGHFPQRSEPALVLRAMRALAARVNAGVSASFSRMYRPTNTSSALATNGRLHETLLAARLRTGTTAAWLEVLDAADVWCAPLHTVDELVEILGSDRGETMAALGR